MNDGESVNMQGSALEEALAAKLEEMLGAVPWLQRSAVQNHPTRSNKRGFDLVVKLDRPSGDPVELWIECKAQPRPSEFPYIFLDEGQRTIKKVLAAPFISPRIAELCQEEGWGWFDLAGNCYLDVPGLLHLERQGIPAVHSPPKPKANLSSPEAGRVVRALLQPRNILRRWTQRCVVEHFASIDKPIAKPSLGLVNKVVTFLREEAFIRQTPEGGFTVTDPLRLLFAWRDAYRLDRHRRLRYFSFLPRPKLQEALAGLELTPNCEALYAAFSAAELQAPHVRQSKTWLFVQQKGLSAFEREADAKQVESGENIIVFVPNDEGIFYEPDAGYVGGNHLACTNIIQTYVDLWHCGSRGEEAAEALLDQRIKREWRAHNALV